jgi:crotonobetainyl-CoA:carnitine CoA-transferase CaiB-like acyl-CoA transferase
LDEVGAGALAGVLVADFSRVLAGPYATMLLGDLGADVVKVEHPNGGDETRRWGPPFVEGVSTYFLGLNRNKRSLVLDLATEPGRAAAEALVARADVVVENLRPTRMARLGLGFEQVQALNPRAVYCSITGFGPECDLPAYDLVVQAAGGLMSVTGLRPGEPTKVGVALVDVIAGLHGALGILAALRERDRSGTGQLVEVNLLSSLLSALVNQSSGFVQAGVVPSATGNRHPSIAPYELLTAADRQIAVAAGTDQQFRALCEVLGLAALVTDTRFADNAARVANREDLAAALTRALESRPAGDWCALLQAAEVPCALVNDVGEAFALAESLGLQAIAHLPSKRGEPTVANPIGLSRTPATYRLAPPALGADTSDILGTLERRSDDTPSRELRN